MSDSLELDAAFLRLLKERPYLGAAIFSLQRRKADGLGTLGVSKNWILYYDPEFCKSIEVLELMGVCYHEVCHLLRDHEGRGKFVDEDELRLWNVAGDLEINDDLIVEGIQLPASGMFPNKFNLKDGLFAEEYMVELRKIAKKIPMQGGAGHGQCGSGSGGEKIPQEAGETDREGLSDGERHVIKQTVARDIQNHAKQQGTVPAQWERYAKDLLEPAVDWKKELASTVRKAVDHVAGSVDYTYRRPSRRQSVYGRVVMPSLYQPVPSVAVVIDTSGSMSENDLSAALGEVEGVLKACGQREGVTVFAVDAAVAATSKVYRADQVVLAGGGGTDMGAGLQAATEAKPRPQICIVLTDGYTPWPATAPEDMDVIVVIIGDQRYGNPEGPEWAKTIKTSTGEQS